MYKYRIVKHRIGKRIGMECVEIKRGIKTLGDANNELISISGQHKDGSLSIEKYKVGAL